MKRILFHIFCLFACISVSAQYVVKGGAGEPLHATTGGGGVVLVYLLNTLNGGEISFTSDDDGTHNWYKYDRDPNIATPISCTQNGRTSYITGIEDGWGYYMGKTNSSQTRYIWIIDYSQYVPRLSSINVNAGDDECEGIQIIAPVDAEPLYYYSGSGDGVRRNEVTRNYTFSYNTLRWDDKEFYFDDHLAEIKLEGIVNEFPIPAPLIDTKFTLRGDSFAEHFGIEQSITSANEYEAVAIEAYAEAIPLHDSGDGESTEDDGSLKSAPYSVLFRAAANEPTAAMFRWKIDKLQEDNTYSTIISRQGDREFEHTFNEDGHYKAEVEVTNKYSTCPVVISMNISVASSEMAVPNYFSPGNSSGYNNEFKVSYRSITNFKCSITNRWGNLLYTWNDPELGWDGRINGMYVATGVYFYHIEYTDSQGKKQSKKGSINVLRETQQ